MAFSKRTESRSTDAQRCRARYDKVQALTAEGTPESRRQLKAMRTIEIRGTTSGAGEYWNPKGKQLARGSSGKCERINRGHRAKLNQAKGI